MVKLLLEHGARSTFRLFKYSTPLLEALLAHLKNPRTPNRCNDTVKRLMGHCNVNAQSNGGNTPLGVAAAGNLVSAVRLLLEQGVRGDVRNQRGETPLAFGVREGRGTNRDAIAVMLEHRSDT